MESNDEKIVLEEIKNTLNDFDTSQNNTENNIVDNFDQKICKKHEFWDQYCALMKRNQILKKRCQKSTLVEILLPVMALVLMIIIQKAVMRDSSTFVPENLHLNDSVHYKREEQLAGFRILMKTKDEVQSPEKILALAPNNSLVEEFKNALTQNYTTNNQSIMFHKLMNPVFKSSQINVFGSEKEIELYLEHFDYGRPQKPALIAAIIFEPKTQNINEQQYKIRMATQSTQGKGSVPDTNGALTDNISISFQKFDYQLYFQNRFLFLQDLVDTQIINRTIQNSNQVQAQVSKNGTQRSVSNLEFVAQPFPVPRHFTDKFLLIVGNQLGLLYTMFSLFVVNRIVKTIVEEKELRIKEHMKSMGLQQSVLSLTWLTTYFLIFLLTALLSVLTTIRSLYRYSNFGIVVAFYLLFGLSIFAFSFMLSSFFSRARLASTFAQILFLASYFGYFRVNTADTNSLTKYGSCLSLSICFGLGTTQFAQYETNTIGINGKTFQAVTGNYSIAGIFGMLFVDFCLYMFLGQYFNKVLPSKYGTRLPQYFLVMPSYQSKNMRIRIAKLKKEKMMKSGKDGGKVHYSQLPDTNIEEQINQPIKTSNINYEDISEQLRQSLADGKGVSVRNLCKIYDSKNEKRFYAKLKHDEQVETSQSTSTSEKEDDEYPQDRMAVNNLCLDMFQGQILSLLGENGAGKTTTINMLTGFYPPTYGDVFMLNTSITTDMSFIRKHLGICPQHDVIQPILTVREHLELYASIKGLKKEYIKTEIQELINSVGLAQQADKEAGKLSGGMKRKLSLAMAFIGNSKIVFLDEPTSGMDPYSRRKIQDLIKSMRRNRVIVLTTHYMDEADYLGDRIAIMAKGQLKCQGSSLFLKNRFGVGYTMTLTSKTIQTQDEKQAEHQDLKQQLLSHVPTAQLLSRSANEYSFRLRFDSSHLFPNMFEDLDSNMQFLGIENYGISVTTLEEVFLKVSNFELDFNNNNIDQIKQNKIRESRQSFSAKQEEKFENFSEKDVELDVFDFDVKETSENKQKFRQFFEHTLALLKKRWIVSIRDQKMWILQCVYTLACLIVGITLTIVGLASKKYSLQLSASQQFNRPNIISWTVDHTANDSSKSTAEYFMNTLMINSLDNPGYEGNEYGLPIIGNVTLENFQRTLLRNLNKLYFSQLERQEQKGTSQYQAFLFDFLNTSNLNNTQRYDILLFNTTAKHSLPTTFNLYNNIRARYYTKNQNIKIYVSNHPFPLLAIDKNRIYSTVGLVIGIAFSFLPAFLVSNIVKERSTNKKHQLMVSGTNMFSYQSSYWIQDIMLVGIIMFITLIILIAFDLKELIGKENVGATLVLFFIFTLSVVPFAYLFSFLFSNHTIAQSIVQQILLLGGSILPIVQIILQAIESTKSANKVLVYFFSLIPNFCVCQSLITLFIRKTVKETESLAPFNQEISLRSIVLMSLEAIIFSSVILLIEQLNSNRYQSRQASRRGNNQVADINTNNIDIDIQNEMNRCETLQPNNEPIILKKLTKFYEKEWSCKLFKEIFQSKDFEQNESESEEINNKENIEDKETKIEDKSNKKLIAAVKNLSFSVPKGQIFGFLGVNGAGKTTTLKMLTGEILPTSGSAYLNGYNILNDQKQIRHNLGYCPQFDALFDFMTAREHLQLYCRLKGIYKKENIGEYIQKLLDCVGLKEYADTITVKYSGGTKRKLSLAIALVGNPRIVFLDEPSTGMDPGSRRFMQDLIIKTMKNRSVILTTHSMEECQALCNRLAIMSQGSLKCIGSFQHLRNRYGNDYQLDINLNNDDNASPERVINFVQEKFPNSKLLDKLFSNIKFRIPKTLNDKDADKVSMQKTSSSSSNIGVFITLGHIFRIIEENKVDLCIQEYSVNETTLEQIFLQFARRN